MNNTKKTLDSLRDVRIKISNKIQVLRQKCELLEKYKKAIIVETISNGFDKKTETEQCKVQPFPKKWKKMRIKDVFSFLPRSQILATEADNGQYDFYTCSNIIKKISTPNLYKEAILISTGGTYNIKLSTIIPSAYSIDVLAMIPKNQVILKYGYYFLISNKEYIGKYCFDGQFIKHLQKDKFLNFTIVYPNIEEQEQVVKFLDKRCSVTDEKINMIQQQINLLNEYEQALIKENSNITKQKRETKNEKQRRNFKYIKQ